MDFLEYDPNATAGRSPGSRHLLAFVTRPRQPVAVVPLGPVAVVAAAVDRCS